MGCVPALCSEFPALSNLLFQFIRAQDDSFGMPKCEHCGFGHALPDRCVNCGSTDPFPRRRVFKLLLGVLGAIALVVAGYYFYERATDLRRAEEKAKAVGERVYETGAVEATGYQ